MTPAAACDMLLSNHSHASQTLALECERLRGTGSHAGIAETVADMSQAFFSAADTHASLGHMPMACSMCVFTAIQAECRTCYTVAYSCNAVQVLATRRPAPRLQLLHRCCRSVLESFSVSLLLSPSPSRPNIPHLISIQMRPGNSPVCAIAGLDGLC